VDGRNTNATPAQSPARWLLWLLATNPYICNMSYVTHIKDELKRIKPFLIDKYHVSLLGLFGSVVRDDYSPTTSDIDIIVDFSKPIGIEFVDLADYIEKELNKKVDLVSKRGIKAKYLAAIEQEIIYV
jgi:predicted nucleotidyltransferase